MKFIYTILLLTFASLSYATNVEIKTNVGTIVVALNDAKAPNTVKNFLSYVKSGHYDNTVFHRVIDGFMIQGGGYDKNYKKKSATKTVENEAYNGLKNKRGTIAMARTNNPHSASAQFFINVKNNAMLDHRGKTSSGWGYAVFGKVINGMNVVDKIKRMKTGAKGSFSSDVPQETVVIQNIKVIK